jgi:hypothetical protein
MADDSFAFAHALFHVILFIVIHGNRARRHKARTSVEPKAKSQIKNRKRKFFDP